MTKYSFSIIVLLVGFAGCHPSRQTSPARPLPRSTSSVTQANPSGSVRDEDEIEVPSDPEWAKTFKQAAALIGKPKSEVVASLGPPKSVYALFSELRYEYDGPGYRMQINFQSYTADRRHPDPNAETMRPASAVAFQLTQMVSDTADSCWEAIDGAKGGPKSLIYPSERLFLPVEKFSDPVAPGFPVRLKGSLKTGTLCVLEGGNPQTLKLQGARTFDLNTNTYRFGPPHNNPQFAWQRTRVGFLFAGDTRHLLWAMHHFDTEIPLP